jgi:hypothetical protein
MKNSWLSVLRLVAIMFSMGCSAVYGGYDYKWQSYTYHYSNYALSSSRYGKDYPAYRDYSTTCDDGRYTQYASYSYQGKDYVYEGRYGLTSI